MCVSYQYTIHVVKGEPPLLAGSPWEQELSSPTRLGDSWLLRLQPGKMDTLMRMQASCDIAQTRKREKQIHVRRIHQVVSVTTHEKPGVSRSRRSA